VLIPSYAVEGTANTRTSTADAKWAIPDEHIEVV
jgi:hypothetical protein